MRDFTPRASADGFRSLRESFAVGKQIRAMNMRGEIAIAEIEPDFAAVDAEALQKMKRFAAHAPARGGIDETSERVGNDVEVRRNFQAVQDDVVTSVDDDRQIVRIHRPVETEEQLGCADAAGESGDFEFFCRETWQR